MIIDTRQSTAAGDKSTYGDSSTSMAATCFWPDLAVNFTEIWSHLDYRDHNFYLPIAGLLHFSNNRVMLQPLSPEHPFWFSCLHNTRRTNDSCECWHSRGMEPQTWVPEALMRIGWVKMTSDCWQYQYYSWLSYITAGHSYRWGNLQQQEEL